MSRLSFGLVSFALPLYARRLGFSFTEIGLLLSASAIAEQALKPIAGHLADRFGLKTSYTSAIAVRSLVALLLMLSSSSWHLYAIRILHGLSESFRDPSVNALIAKNGSRKTLASSFAWYATAKTIAGSVGKAGAGWLLAARDFGYTGVFAAAFLLSVLPLVVVARYVRDDRDENAMASATGGLAEAGDSQPPPGNQQSIFSFAMLGFLIAASANMLQNLFPIVAVEYAGLSEAETGLIYTLTIPVVIISGPLFGWVSDNISRNLALTVRGVANILSSLLYVAFPTFPGMATGKLVDDMGKAAFRPAWGALMSRISGFHPRRRARTIGYLSLGEGLGEILGPALAGLLWNLRGLTAVIATRVLLALVNEAYAVTLARRLERNRWHNLDEGDSVKS